MGRGNTENCAAPWDAATERTARQHGTRRHVELRGDMGRGNTENCAAPWDAATQRTARHHGTRQYIKLRGTMDERQHTSARHHGRRRDYLAARAALWVEKT